MREKRENETWKKENLPKKKNSIQFIHWIMCSGSIKWLKKLRCKWLHADRKLNCDKVLFIVRIALWNWFPSNAKHYSRSMPLVTKRLWFTPLCLNGIQISTKTGQVDWFISGKIMKWNWPLKTLFLANFHSLTLLFPYGNSKIQLRDGHAHGFQIMSQGLEVIKSKLPRIFRVSLLMYLSAKRKLEVWIIMCVSLQGFKLSIESMQIRYIGDNILACLQRKVI